MNIFLLLLLNVEIPNNIFYLKINSFEEYDYYDAKCQIDQRLAGSEKIDGVILDLRDNPGGVIAFAQNLCEYWIAQGDTISKTTYFSGESNYRISQNSAPSFQNIPTVILVNRQTASAAELVTLSLRYHQKTKIIGQRTAGVYEVKYCQSGLGGYIWMTIGTWTIHGLSAKGGIKPNLIVKNQSWQLEKAIKYLENIIEGRKK